MFDLFTAIFIEFTYILHLEFHPQVPKQEGHYAEDLGHAWPHLCLKLIK